jgi:hypothetical protein
VRFIILILLSISMLQANVFFSTATNILKVEDPEQQMITKKELYCISEFSNSFKTVPVGKNLELGEIKYQCTDNLNKIDLLKKSIKDRENRIFLLLTILILSGVAIFLLFGKNNKKELN